MLQMAMVLAPFLKEGLKWRLCRKSIAIRKTCPPHNLANETRTIYRMKPAQFSG